ncbi:hypothetical protein ACWDYJ_11660 [Streptomyces sp. NPDC003042]
MAVINLRREAEQRDPVPVETPKPVPGCRRCLSLVVRRKNAGSVQDYSGVTDANVLIREHQAVDHP